MSTRNGARPSPVAPTVNGAAVSRQVDRVHGVMDLGRDSQVDRRTAALPAATEVAQAFEDFHAGRFGPVPALARL
jgi:hypothetical protein